MQAVVVYDIKEENRGVRHKPTQVFYVGTRRVPGSCDLGSRRVPGFVQTAMCSIISSRERDAFLDTSPFSA